MDLSPRHEGHHEVKTDQYWAFGYSFEALNDAQKHQRRDYLDWYGFAAQWSVLLILAGFQLVFFLNWIVNSALNSDQPKSPSFNKRPDGVARWLRGVHSTWSRMAWWMKKELVKGWSWGTRGEWIGGLAWTAWLLYLCFAHTRPGESRWGSVVAVATANSIQTICISPSGLARSAHHNCHSTTCWQCGRLTPLSNI